MVKSGQLTNIVDSVSTTNQQNLSTIKNVDLRKSHPHQQNWSIVQIVDSLLDPNQQSVSLKIGETTKCTLGFFLHNNKFVDQQSGSNVQIVVSGPTSTNCVIPNLPRGSRQLYQKCRQPLRVHIYRYSCACTAMHKHGRQTNNCKKKNIAKIVQTFKLQIFHRKRNTEKKDH